MAGVRVAEARLRIVVGEARVHEGAPLHRVILDLLRAERCAGATVLKGTAGFGAAHGHHTAMLEVTSSDLPIVIEVVDAEVRLDAILAKLEPLMDGGLITVERTAVMRYAPPPSGA